MVLSIVPLLSPVMEESLNYSIKMIGYGALSLAFGIFIGATVYGTVVDKNDTLQTFQKLAILMVVAIFIGIIVFLTKNFPVYFLVNHTHVSYATIIQFTFFFTLGIFAGAYETYQLKIIQEEAIAGLESTTFGLYTGISNLGQLMIADLIILSISDYFHISVLLTMQFLSVAVIVSITLIKKLKFQ